MRLGAGDRTVVARRLRAARLGARLSQKALGIAAGINEFSASPRMNQYERGKHLPDVLTLSRIAEVLRLPVAYFFCDEDELALLVVRFHRLAGASKRRFVKRLVAD